MKIILTSVGTRGDMEPFLAIGKILKENNQIEFYIMEKLFTPYKKKAEQIKNQMVKEDFSSELHQAITE